VGLCRTRAGTERIAALGDRMAYRWPRPFATSTHVDIWTIPEHLRARRWTLSIKLSNTKESPRDEIGMRSRQLLSLCMYEEVTWPCCKLPTLTAARLST
jgi:hypothetical protein